MTETIKGIDEVYGFPFPDGIYLERSRPRNKATGARATPIRDPLIWRHFLKQAM